MNWNTCCHYARNLQHGLELRRERHYDSKREAGEKEKKTKKKGGGEGEGACNDAQSGENIMVSFIPRPEFLNERLFMKTSKLLLGDRKKRKGESER